jgi:integrase
LPGTDLAVKTRNNYLGYIQNMFRMAQKWDLIEHDIFARVDKFRNPLENSLKVAIMTVPQMSAFLRAVESEFRPLFALNAFTGLRRQEIERLDWSEIKLERNLIDLPAEKGKNRRRKLIEVPPNLVDWLRPFERSRRAN